MNQQNPDSHRWAPLPQCVLFPFHLGTRFSLSQRVRSPFLGTTVETGAICPTALTGCCGSAAKLKCWAWDWFFLDFRLLWGFLVNSQDNRAPEPHIIFIKIQQNVNYKILTKCIWHQPLILSTFHKGNALQRMEKCEEIKLQFF